MPRTLLVVPTGHGVGLTTICLGMVHAFERSGQKVGFCKPIAQPTADGRAPKKERSTALVSLTTDLTPPDPIPSAQAEALLSEDDTQVLMEQVVERYQQAAKDADVVIIEGLVPGEELFYAIKVNQAMATTLDAEVVLVAAPGRRKPAEAADAIEIASRTYAGTSIAGVILNKLKPTLPEQTHAHPVLASMVGADPSLEDRDVAPYRDALAAEDLKLIGAIPWRTNLVAPRVSDLAKALGAEVMAAGDAEHRRVRRVALCGRGIPEVLDAFQPGTLLICPGDRHEILLAAALAATSGIHLAGILLTHGAKPEKRVMDLCQGAIASGLPLLVVPDNSFATANAVHEIDLEVPMDDADRAREAMNHIANNLGDDWLAATGVVRERRLSPPAFRHQLIRLAREADKRIVLPEGEEPRTIAAAAICQQRGIARCVLLGDPDVVHKVANEQGVELPEGIEILRPEEHIDTYVAPMVTLRKAKGLTEAAARDQLKDSVVLGTMMLKQDDVDGLVSGAVHSTANTIRPALQLIKTSPGCSLVSSVFFMCLPDQVVVFGDCAVNPNPSAQQLADIAISAAENANAFGIDPRVAMISYSTGTSGAGEDVEKVAEATKLAQTARPDLLIDGPLQYDAAAVPSVGAKKAPDSKVAGRALVYIFPDLNTGNTTYKAVQRSAGVISIGPMLQGLAKPVNDLSRGALVEDIVFTIALTAIQATQAPAEATV